MQRITITIDDDLMEQFDRFMAEQAYENRSEAIRDLLREKLESERIEQDTGQCVAALTYVFSHEERELAKRLTKRQHHAHDLALSTMHVHLDHDSCLETTVLRGSTASVRDFGRAVIAERGVRHGNLHMVPVDLQMSDHSHQHGDEEGTTALPHVHSKPHT
ncbi:MAG: nickel-responsive transcriptional regulator NikR [Magnetovibrionaceae bacterium]